MLLCPIGGPEAMPRPRRSFSRIARTMQLASLQVKVHGSAMISFELPALHWLRADFLPSTTTIKLRQSRSLMTKLRANFGPVRIQSANVSESITPDREGEAKPRRVCERLSG